MTDIVELARTCGADGDAIYCWDIAKRIADELEIMRQRVAELEAVLSKTDAALAEIGELAALKQQGEPVAWLFSFEGFQQELLFPHEVDPDAFSEHPENFTPLHIVPLACYSAGDMADAQAKAFRDGRSVGYNKGYDDE